jgi:hypothetical protein
MNFVNQKTIEGKTYTVYRDSDDPRRVIVECGGVQVELKPTEPDSSPSKAPAERPQAKKPSTGIPMQDSPKVVEASLKDVWTSDQKIKELF